MTSFRVTQRSISQASLYGLENNLASLSRTQLQLSSGKRITKPSDDPTGTVTAMQYRTNIIKNGQYSRNAADAVARLGVTDSTLSDMNESLSRVRDLVLSASNVGAAPLQAREAKSIRDGLIQSANTKYLDRPIFTGSSASIQAYDTNGTFTTDPGATTPVTRAVGDGENVRVDLNGPDVFGDDTSGNLFKVVSDIADHMTTDPNALGGDLAKLDTLLNRLRSAQSDVGARYNRAETAGSYADNQVGNLTSSLTGVEDVDVAKTAVDLASQNAAYQASLAATAKIITPTLASFLS
jgi:flagellar hook-associated protein 3 FlgL